MELINIAGGIATKGLNTGYKQDVSQFNKFAAGRILSQNLICEYFDTMKAEGKSVSTIQRHRAAIKKALLSMAGKKASVSQIIQVETFFKEIKTGKQKKEITQENILTRDEMKDLINVSGRKTALLIQALFETAGRVSELVNIRLSDCEITKDGVIIKIIGKGAKEGEFFMPVELFQKIRTAYPGDIYLFQFKGRPLSRFTVLTMIKRAARKIGRPDVTPHTLRHTWASMSINTLGLSKTSKYLRHSSTDVTAKFYLHGTASVKEIMANNILHKE